MRIPRIYTNQALASHQTYELEEAASHYLAKVLRLQAGRPLIVFNGRGGEYQAEIRALGKNCATIETGIFLDENRCSPLKTELAIGISRGERMDWVLQKATELGVSRIVPLFSERCEVRLSGDRLKKKMQHWQQIIISASEQSQRNLLPELAVAQTLIDYTHSTEATLKLALHHLASDTLVGLHKTMHEPPSSVVLLIGPEGGLSESEIEYAVSHKFRTLKLGPRVLRTETAPLAALCIVQQYWGDMGE